jgi:hypothetical protein
MCWTCRLEKRLRVFKLLTLKDEYAYVLSEDYAALIERMHQQRTVCEPPIGTCAWMPAVEVLC